MNQSESTSADSDTHSGPADSPEPGEAAGSEGPSGASPVSEGAFARLRNEEQMVAGGGRWSLDASRRSCHRCQQQIRRGTPFWTVLTEADVDQAGDGVAAFFSRQDHCEACIESIEQVPFFARWKTSVPAAQGQPARVVNIASLHATFLSLIEMEATAVDTDQQAADPDDQFCSGKGSASSASLEVSASANRTRIAYLLALFLVRKRALRWIGHEDGVLTVAERSGALHQVPVSTIEPATIEQAVAEMEQLLG